MSKIGKLPIVLPNGVSATVSGSQVQVTGARGNVSYDIPSGISAEVADGKLMFSAKDISDKKFRALFGLTRANVANIVKGVDSGFEKKLELVGVGYRAQMQGNDLVLSLGFSHPVKFTPKEGVKITVNEGVIIVTGSNKIDVGEAAAKIRAIKKPEPYKGKGIKYKDEKIRKKAGKAAKAAAGATGAK